MNLVYSLPRLAGKPRLQDGPPPGVTNSVPVRALSCLFLSFSVRGAFRLLSVGSIPSPGRLRHAMQRPCPAGIAPFSGVHREVGVVALDHVPPAASRRCVNGGEQSRPKYAECGTTSTPCASASAATLRMPVSRPPGDARLRVAHRTGLEQALELRQHRVSPAAVGMPPRPARERALCVLRRPHGLLQPLEVERREFARHRDRFGDGPTGNCSPP